METILTSERLRVLESKERGKCLLLWAVAAVLINDLYIILYFCLFNLTVTHSIHSINNMEVFPSEERMCNHYLLTLEKNQYITGPSQ